jgi:hypothetical protein
MTNLQEKTMFVLWLFERNQLSERNFVTELSMDKIRLQIMVSDFGCSSFKSVIVSYTEKEQEDVDGIQEAFSQSPQKSTRRAYLLFNILHTTVCSSKMVHPPYWSRIVREFLDTHLPGRWVGRDGPIPWLPRSPHYYAAWLVPVGGYFKDIVYKTTVTFVDEINLGIVAAIQTFTPEMLENAWKEIG